MVREYQGTLCYHCNYQVGMMMNCVLWEIIMIRVWTVIDSTLFLMVNHFNNILQIFILQIKILMPLRCNEWGSQFRKYSKTKWQKTFKITCRQATLCKQGYLYLKGISKCSLFFFRIIMTRKSGRHCMWLMETLNNCFNLIRSHQQHKLWSPFWRSNQCPQNAEPKLNHCATDPHRTQAMPN